MFADCSKEFSKIKKLNVLPLQFLHTYFFTSSSGGISCLLVMTFNLLQLVQVMEAAILVLRFGVLHILHKLSSVSVFELNEKSSQVLLLQNEIFIRYSTVFIYTVWRCQEGTNIVLH